MTTPPGTICYVARKVPTYPLAEVQQLARFALVHRKRGILPVADRLGLSERAAEARVLEKLLALKPNNFVDTKDLDFDPPIAADIYGLCDDDGNWYIKIFIQNGRVTIVSCHGPMWALTCIDGTVIKEQQP